MNIAMTRSILAALAAMLLLGGNAQAAPATKRTLFNQMDQLRARDAMALLGQGAARIAHEKEWAEFLPRVKREFGEDHACFKAAQHSQSVWRALNDALRTPNAIVLDTIAKLAFNAGGWETSCSDEVDKVAP